MARFICTALLLFFAAMAAKAQEAELALDDNINIPAVPSRRHAAVAEHAAHTVARLRKSGFSASTIRNGEVVLASLPCDTLFAANATDPKPEAAKRLRALLDIVTQPARYKVLVAVHADDTGDDTYADYLTEARANAIDHLLWDISGKDEDTNVVIYGLGADEPLRPNNSRINRRHNRRVEFYIVPIQF